MIATFSELTHVFTWREAKLRLLVTGAMSNFSSHQKNVLEFITVYMEIY